MGKAKYFLLIYKKPVVSQMNWTDLLYLSSSKMIKIEQSLHTLILMVAFSNAYSYILSKLKQNVYSTLETEISARIITRKPTKPEDKN